jgi:hypothetical protein
MAELDHEVANVVNGLLGMARLVRESGLSAEQDYWLEAIEHSGRQLGQLVKAFLRRQVAPERPMRVHASHLDGIDLIEQVVISHAPAARSGANQLLLIASTEVSRHWYVDPCLLRQLLDNLLGNAVKFTRSGRILLEVGVEAADRCPRDTLVMKVSDTGPGVDEALRESLFEAYRKGSETDHAGTGLGLYICRNIAHAMGGGIGWSNCGSGGACFELRVPAVVAEDRAPALPAPWLLRSLRCQLRLSGPVLQSVGSILSRIGVCWSLERAGKLGRDELPIVIEEAPFRPRDPGPNLALRVADPARESFPEQTLRAPILEATLGPLLLQMALDALRAPDAGQG